MDEDKPGLTRSQLQFLEELRTERDRRRWLWRSLKVWGSWIAGVVAAVFAGYPNAVKFIKWLGSVL